MGQLEVMNWLKGKGWVHSRDVHQAFNSCYSSVNKNLRCLAKHQIIRIKPNRTKHQGYMYRYK